MSAALATARFLGELGDTLSAVEIRVPEHVHLMGSLVAALGAIDLHILRIDVQRRGGSLDHVIHLAERDGSPVSDLRRAEVQRVLLDLLDRLLIPQQHAGDSSTGTALSAAGAA